MKLTPGPLWFMVESPAIIETADPSVFTVGIGIEVTGLPANPCTVLESEDAMAVSAEPLRLKAIVPPKVS